MRWVDPADVGPGMVVTVNLMWSPLPAFNNGNDWPTPPEPPYDTEIGFWAVASRQAPTLHDTSPFRWSTLVSGLTLLFQDDPDALLVDVEGRIWRLPHGTPSVIAVEWEDPEVAAIQEPCEASNPEGRSCSLSGPHPTHRSEFPFEFWPNTAWRKPGEMIGKLVDLAASIPSERNESTRGESDPPEVS